MRYTESEIIKQCEMSIQKSDDFYKNKFVNYRGKSTDTKEFYTEIVAKFVYENLFKFDIIKQVTRESSYKVKTHDGKHIGSSNRIEEIIAMKLYNQSCEGTVFKGIGKVLDYQIPLKNKAIDSVGKIDLISINEDTIFLLELKREDSKETMLRCILEGYTYYKTINNIKLIKDFELCQSYTLMISPLVFYKGSQWLEMQEDRPWLKKLMNKLEVKPFYLEKIEDRYSIKEEI
jgi:hypothetical protein